MQLSIAYKAYPHFASGALKIWASNMAAQKQIKQLEEELRIAQDEEATLNKQSNGQEGTWAVEEAIARLYKVINKSD